MVKHADLVWVNNKPIVEWRFSNHAIYSYFLYNTLQRLEAVQSVNMRLDVINMTPEEMLAKM